MGQPIPTTERQNINKGIYWAVAAAILILVAFAFTASRNKPEQMPVQNNTMNVAPDASGAAAVPNSTTAPTINTAPTDTQNNMGTIPPNSETINNSGYSSPTVDPNAPVEERPSNGTIQK